MTTPHHPLSRLQIHAPLGELLHPIADRNHRVPSQFLLEEGLRHLQLESKVSRDGTALLQRFFTLVPVPRDRRENLILHEDCRPVVPRSWSSQVQYFRYARRPKPRPRVPSNLLVCGLFIPGLHDVELIRRTLREVRRAAGRLLRPGARPARFLPCFADFDGLRPRPTSFEAETIAAFLDVLGEDAEPMGWQEFQGRPSYWDWAFVEIVDRAVCTDSALTQCLLDRGAVPLLPKYPEAGRASAKRLSLPLSPYHCIEIEGATQTLLSSWAKLNPAFRLQAHLAAGEG